MLATKVWNRFAMSALQNDIKRLRDLTTAPPHGLLSSDEEALLRVCGALEASVKEIANLEDQVDVEGAKTARLEMKLEKCIAFLQKAEDYEHPVATEAHDLLKELGNGLGGINE